MALVGKHAIGRRKVKLLPRMNFMARYELAVKEILEKIKRGEIKEFSTVDVQKLMCSKIVDADHGSISRRLMADGRVELVRIEMMKIGANRVMRMRYWRKGNE